MKVLGSGSGKGGLFSHMDGAFELPMIWWANGSVAPDSSRIKRTEAAFRVAWNVAGEPTREDARGMGGLAGEACSQPSDREFMEALRHLVE